MSVHGVQQSTYICIAMAETHACNTLAKTAGASDLPCCGMVYKFKCMYAFMAQPPNRVPPRTVSAAPPCRLPPAAPTPRTVHPGTWALPHDGILHERPQRHGPAGGITSVHVVMRTRAPWRNSHVHVVCGYERSTCMTMHKILLAVCVRTTWSRLACVGSTLERYNTRCKHLSADKHD